MCALDVAAATQARASIAVRCQVLQRECSSQMRCHLALLWMQVVCALTTGTEGRALAISTCDIRALLARFRLSANTVVISPSRPMTRPFPSISQLAEAVNGPVAGLAAARVSSGGTCAGCIESTATSLRVAASFLLKQLL